MPEDDWPARCLEELSNGYRRMRVIVVIGKDRRPALVRIEGLSAGEGEDAWEPVPLHGAARSKVRSRLTNLGIDVAAEEIEDALGAVLPLTSLDTLASLLPMIMDPAGTFIPKLAGRAAEVLACHAGIPPGLPARLAGMAVEQAVKPLCQQDPVTGKILAGVECVIVTCDLADGQITAAVVNLALDKLADQLKARPEVTISE